ncbi:putative potassium transporter 17 [Camellia lanceoleosa]|uniref:Potassium transporter 17 n=1 Tax=Camellia lanceoleosa TaxID=1840588 RepID=A0ACC0G1U4_9ERIC|nr:putative potassium transporter 17 [Camellia lanceoleosa]
MHGIRATFPSVSKSIVEVLSAIVLIVLFLLQKYGTSRVRFNCLVDHGGRIDWLGKYSVLDTLDSLM